MPERVLEDKPLFRVASTRPGGLMRSVLAAAREGLLQ